VFSIEAEHEHRTFQAHFLLTFPDRWKSHDEFISSAPRLRLLSIFYSEPDGALSRVEMTSDAVFSTSSSNGIENIDDIWTMKRILGDLKWVDSSAKILATAWSADDDDRTRCRTFEPQDTGDGRAGNPLFREVSNSILCHIFNDK
jgi:hypothetical protein